MELSEVMRTMSGVRLYRPEDVPDQVIYAALDDARFAPSGGNRQPWRVVVIRDDDMRKKVSEISSREWNNYTAKWYPPAEELTPAKAKKLREGTDYHANMHHAPVHLFVWAEIGALALMDRDLDPGQLCGGEGRSTPSCRTCSWGCQRGGWGLASPLWRSPPRRSGENCWRFPRDSDWRR